MRLNNNSPMLSVSESIGHVLFGINCSTADQSWETRFPKKGRMKSFMTESISSGWKS